MKSLPIAKAFRPDFENLRGEFTPGISDSEFIEIASLFVARTYRRKDLITMTNASTGFMAFVSRGCVKSFFVDASGREAVLFFTTEAGWFCHSMTDNNRRDSSFAQAMEDTELLCISPNNYDHLVKTSAPFSALTREVQERKLMLYEQELIRFHTQSPVERYTALVERSSELLSRVSRHDLARYLGICPQSLSRMQRRLLRQKRRVA